MTRADPWAALPGIPGQTEVNIQSIQQQIQIADSQVAGTAAINPQKIGVWPGCSVSQTGTGNIAISAWATLVFNSVDYDSANIFDGTSTFTIPINGRWFIRAWVDWAVNATGFRAIAIFNSGQLGVAGQAFTENRSVANASFGHSHEVTRLCYLGAGTKLIVGVFQNAANPLSTSNGDMVGASAMFSAQWMGPKP